MPEITVKIDGLDDVRQRLNEVAQRMGNLCVPHRRGDEPVMPYLVYRHGDSRVPRPDHLSWDGIVLPKDDPWWDTHFPQNGWGCKCRVYAAGEREKAQAASVGKNEAPDDGTYTPIDKKTGKPMLDPQTGKPMLVPVGIDPGFDYNPGRAAFGKPWIPETGAVRELGPWRPRNYPFLEKKLTGMPLPVGLGPRCHTEGDLRKAVPEGTYTDPLGEYASVTQAVASHILADPDRWDGREQYFPLIPDVIEHPQEIWIGFMQFVDSGRVFLRRRYVKAYEVEDGRVVGVLADAVRGQAAAFDAIHSDNMSGGRLRSGRLVYPGE